MSANEVFGTGKSKEDVYDYTRCKLEKAFNKMEMLMAIATEDIDLHKYTDYENGVLRELYNELLIMFDLGDGE